MTNSVITHRTGRYSDTDPESLIWEITDEQGIAAELYVSTDRYEIMQIEVRADRRREGLARALYTAATTTTTIYHAPVGHRTEEGAAFAEATGGPTAEYDCDCYACTWTAEDED